MDQLLLERIHLVPSFLRHHLHPSQAVEQRARGEQLKRGEEAEARLGVQVATLSENVATLKREWQGSQRRVGELEKQTDELRGEIAVLEATVQNNQDERRALLQRWVGVCGCGCGCGCGCVCVFEYQNVRC